MPGYRHLKKFGPEKFLTTIRKKGLLENATKYLKSGENLGEKLDTRRTSSGRHFFLKKNVSLKKHVKFKGPITNHHARNKWRSQLFKQDPLQRITNARVPEESWIKQLTGEPNVEFDDIVIDKDVASRNAKQDEALLKELMSNENGMVLDKPVKYDSHVAKNEDNAVTEQPNAGKKHQTQSYGVSESGIKGGNANDNDTEPVEEQSTRRQVSKFNKEHHKALPLRKDDHEEKEGQDKEDEEDERKPAEVIKEEEEQLLQLLNNDHKIEPMDLSNQMSETLQAFTPNFQKNQAQFNSMVNQERQLETMKELQAKQEMLQRLQLTNARNIMLQNSQTPKYLSQQLRRPFTGAPMRVPIVYGPTTPNYQPAYEGSFPSASPPAQTANQGYSIDVDGVKGIFTKNSGFALRFQSPDSDVTVIKRKDTVSPRIGYS